MADNKSKKTIEKEIERLDARIYLFELSNDFNAKLAYEIIQAKIKELEELLEML